LSTAGFLGGIKIEGVGRKNGCLIYDFFWKSQKFENVKGSNSSDMEFDLSESGLRNYKFFLSSKIPA
jgi:hypothetical protein